MIEKNRKNGIENIRRIIINYIYNRHKLGDIRRTKDSDGRSSMIEP